MNSSILNNLALINTVALKSEFKSELDNILKWWRTNMPDAENGGFFGRIDSEGIAHPEADKGVILNTRILWAFSAAGRAIKDTQYEIIANRAYEYLRNYFWDELEGGVYWSVDYLGNPLDKQKQIYAQAFAIYSLSEYYLLTKNQEALDKATVLFKLIEKQSLDPKKGGYLNAFASDWSSMEDVRLSEKDANEAKIMNTHLHVLEAYTNLYRAKPFHALKNALKNTIQLLVEHFYLPEQGSLQVYFDENWTPKGQGISFGHNIEASWLLWEAAEVLADENLLNKVRPISVHLAEVVLNTAIDKDGGLFYETDQKGLKDTDKHWWVQAEAVLGFWNAAQLTHDSKFIDATMRSWNFIKKSVIDKKLGEWNWRTDRNGTPNRTEDKAGPWKAPYHNARMCLEMIRRLA